MPFESKRFDLTLPTNGGISISLIGASRSGKTTLLKYIYKTHFQKYITTMFSMNRQADIYKDLDIDPSTGEVTTAATYTHGYALAAMTSGSGVPRT